MATSGAAAWAKYYRGKGNIETVAKNEASLYDENKKPTDKKIALGKKLTVLSMPQYDSMPRILLDKNSLFRIKFDDLVKPGSKQSAAVNLKPQAFGVANKTIPITEYITIILSTIEERTDLPADLKLYLTALINYYSAPTNTKFKESLKNAYKPTLPVNDITKDFGEVVGPIALQKQQLLKVNKINLSPNMKVEIPLRPNEPLVDYYLVDGNKKYSISAKASGKSGNVVKPADIIFLISRSKTTYAKWAKTKVYGVLKAIDEGTLITGPAMALHRANNSISSAAIDALKKSATHGGSFTITKAPFAQFIHSRPYLRNKTNITVNELVYEMESELTELTKTKKLDMTPIFIDAVLNHPFYVKFGIDKTGMGIWHVVEMKELQSHGIYLRSKNGYTRRSDKIGIAV